jgi:hypothetical protein
VLPHVFERFVTGRVGGLDLGARFTLVLPLPQGGGAPSAG